MNFLFRLIVILSFSQFVHAVDEHNISDWKKDPFLKKNLYYRDYSAEHLRENPTQTVQTIVIEFIEIPPEAKLARKLLGTFDPIPVVYVKYIDLPDWYLQIVNCNKNMKSQIYNCFVDDDGGQFSIKLDESKLILKGNIRTDMCGIMVQAAPDDMQNTTVDLYDKSPFLLYKINDLPSKTKKKIKACSDFFFS
jgi:hypothetical protein